MRSGLSSAIEHALYGNRGTHGVVEFSLEPGYIRLRVAPWEELAAWVVAVFPNAKLTSVEAYADEIDVLVLPWDIIAFDSYELSAGRWEFVLHCGSIEWCFESGWPAIERKPAEQSGHGSKWACFG